MKKVRLALYKQPYFIEVEASVFKKNNIKFGRLKKSYWGKYKEFVHIDSGIGINGLHYSNINNSFEFAIKISAENENEFWEMIKKLKPIDEYINEKNKSR